MEEKLKLLTCLPIQNNIKSTQVNRSELWHRRSWFWTGCLWTRYWSFRDSEQKWITKKSDYKSETEKTKESYHVPTDGNCFPECVLLSCGHANETRTHLLEKVYLKSLWTDKTRPVPMTKSKKLFVYIYSLFVKENWKKKKIVILNKRNLDS